jgi:hypothetical protein
MSSCTCKCSCGSRCVVDDLSSLTITSDSLNNLPIKRSKPSRGMTPEQKADKKRAYYWANRDKVLEKSRLKRAAKKDESIKQKLNMFTDLI